MKTMTRSGVTGSLLILIVLTAAMTIFGCTSGTDGKKGSIKDNITQTLMSKTWVGKISTQPVTLTFTQENKVLKTEMMYTYFSKPGVQEMMTAEVTDSGTVILRGTSYKRISGFGDFALDTLTGTLSADTVTLSGIIRDKYHPDGAPWSVSSKQKIEEIDPPIDMKKAESTLLTGQWVGIFGKKPASIKFVEKQGNLSAQIKVAKAVTNLQVEINDNGMIIMKSQPKPSGQSLITETYNGKFDPDYQTIIGVYENIVKQGFVESSYSDVWGFENKKK